MLSHRTVFSRWRVRSLGALVFTFAVAALAAGHCSSTASADEAPSIASSIPGDAHTELAVIATPRGFDVRESEVRFLTVDKKGAHETFSQRVPHARDAVVRGDLLPGRRAVAVVCDEDAPHEADYGSSLYLVDAQRGLRELVSGVYHASRPLASTDGKIYVERGKPGPTPEHADLSRLREDAVEIDAIDPDTGATRVLYIWSGYTLHLAGELDGELLVYRVGRSGADLVAVERSSGKSRLVNVIPPFARDFSVDAPHRALVMSNRDDVDAHLWTVESVDLASGARTRLSSARDEAPVPYVLRKGELAIAMPSQPALSVRSLTTKIERSVASSSFRFDAVDAETQDGAWTLVSHRGASGFELAALHMGSTVPVPLTARAENLQPVGFFGAANGGRR